MICEKKIATDLIYKEVIPKFHVIRDKDEKIGIWTEAKLIHTTNISGLKSLKFYHGSTCDLVLEDEEEQKRVGTCMAEASLSISFPRPQLTNKS